jgi:hypothetical protein
MSTKTSKNAGTATDTSADTASVAREEVILKKDHEHGDKKCKAGEKIFVTASQKARLVKREAI